jgi:hypothetical protein
MISDNAREVSRGLALEGKGREGKGKDLLSEIGREESVENYSETIINLWSAFPAKSRDRSSKKKVNDEWSKAKGKPTPEIAIEKILGWSQSHEWTKDGGQFAPGAHLWIKERKWESEIPASDQASNQKQTKTNSVHEMGLS